MQTAARLFRSMGGSSLVAATASLLWLPLSMGALAQSAEVSQPTSSSTAAAVIPQQVRFTGTLPNRTANTVEAVFKIYATAEGGEALWTETQRVTASADGSYSVLLGAASQSGLPQSVFAGGQARWVGVSVDSGEELPRSPLSSVAYAMKAGDAESVGGLSAANLVTKDDLAKLAQATAAVQPQPQGVQQAVTPTGSGTADYVALWTAAGNLGNSNIFQASSGFLGIGTTTPGGPLELATGATGGANATLMLEQTSAASGNYYADLGLYNSHGLIGNLSALGAGYPAGAIYGANDVVFLGGQQNVTTNVLLLTNTGGALKFGTGGYAKTDERMRIGKTGGISIGNGYVATDPGAGNLIVSGNVGVGTPAPAANLEVNGTAKFDGLVTFASGQTFPGGSGGVTGIITAPPLTSSGETGTVMLGLDNSLLESQFNTVYAQLNGTDNFSDPVTFGQGLTGLKSTGFGGDAVRGTGTSGSTGVYGSSDLASGVDGVSSSGKGVVGQVANPAPASEGVLGYTGSNYSGTYTSEEALLYAGVWGDTSAGGSSGVGVGVAGSADNALAGAFVNNSDTYPALTVGNSQGLGAHISGGSTGDGLDVISNNSDGIDASTTYGAVGIYGINYEPSGTFSGVMGVAAEASVVSSSFNVYGGVWGDTGVNGDDAAGSLVFGILGTADNTSAAYFYNRSNDYATLSVGNGGSGGVGTASKGSGLFTTIMASSPNGTCGIGGGSLSCTGPIKSLASAGGGSRTVETYAMQSPENWMEDFGSGSLVDGKATISIDPAFAETVSGDSSYKVFLTPTGDSKGLYVTAKTANGFEVRESSGGTSSLGFDYRIVAKRAGYEAQRMVDVTEAFTRERAKATATKFEGVRKVRPVEKPSVVEQAMKMPRRAVVPGAGEGKVPQAAVVLGAGKKAVVPK